MELDSFSRGHKSTSERRTSLIDTTSPDEVHALPMPSFTHCAQPSTVVVVVAKAQNAPTLPINDGTRRAPRPRRSSPYTPTQPSAAVHREDSTASSCVSSVYVSNSNLPFGSTAPFGAVASESTFPDVYDESSATAVTAAMTAATASASRWHDVDRTETAVTSNPLCSGDTNGTECGAKKRLAIHAKLRASTHAAAAAPTTTPVSVSARGTCEDGLLSAHSQFEKAKVIDVNVLGSRSGGSQHEMQPERETTHKLSKREGALPSLNEDALRTTKEPTTRAASAKSQSTGSCPFPNEEASRATVLQESKWWKNIVCLSTRKRMSGPFPSSFPTTKKTETDSSHRRSW